MQLSRASGILLHPSSLPASPGIGTLGAEAYRFVDWLVEAGQSLWQVLPLGPTGYGDSPYASFSSFAGNPLLVDLDALVADGLLSREETAPPEWIRSEGPIDYGAVVHWKKPLLRIAARSFLGRGGSPAYRDFVKRAAFWLDEYALFMDIKDYHDRMASEEGKPGGLWHGLWPKELAARKRGALVAWARGREREIEERKAEQFFFFAQWEALRSYARAKGVSLIGDIPIFVAPDSADAWANQRLFQLTPGGAPLRVAGVPPDYFSETGQLWGNPLYDWKAMAHDQYRWWVARMRWTLSLVDYVRVDHFRGFESYWSVPSDERTAVNGRWVKGPGAALFKALRRSLGDLPIIAEDLGVITDEVRALREGLGLPGMRVLQFAFDPAEAKKNGMINPFLPHMYEPNTVVYTGTHDNDTTLGWISAAGGDTLALVRRYLGAGAAGPELARALVRAAYLSVAAFAIVPLQDVLGIGSEGRMNTPSTSGANWAWRAGRGTPGADEAAWLKELSFVSARNGLLAREQAPE